MSLIPASANRTPSTRRRRRRSAGTVSAGLERLEPRQMLAVDINGDGLTDLLWQNDGGGVIAWIRDGSGRNTTATRFVGGDSQWRLTALGDFDGDGVTDVIWRQQATGVCVLWLMRGDGYGIWGSRVLGGDQQWQIEATGDYNGDGRTDLIWRHAPTGINVMWLMDGTNNGEAKAIGGDLTWRLVVHNPDYDANGDGRTDLIWRQSSTGAHVFWNMNGFTVESARENGRSLDWTLVGVGTKGPGRNDLLWRHDRSGVTVRWVDSWAASFEVLLASPEWTVAGTPDLDHDGIYDIAWQHVTGGTLAWVGNGRAAVPLGGAWQWSVVQPTRHDSGAFPAPPVALTPTAGNGQVALQWSPPAGSDVSSYEIQWSTNSSFSWPASVAFTSGTSYTVTNLVNGTQYFFRVAAVNSAGTGSYSGTVAATPSAPPTARPGTPNAPGVARRQTDANVSWDAPSNGGSPIQGYIVQWSTDASFLTFSEKSTSSLSTAINQLAAGVLYYVRVAAFNANGRGNFSAATASAAVETFWWEGIWQFSLNRVSDGLITYSGSATLSLFKISDDGFTTRIRVGLLASRDTRPYKTDVFTGRGVLPYSIEGDGTWEITASSDFLKNNPDAFVSDYLSGNFIENGDYEGDPSRAVDSVFFLIRRNGQPGAFALYESIRGVRWTSAQSP